MCGSPLEGSKIKDEKRENAIQINSKIAKQERG